MSKFTKGMADATARIVSNSKREIRKVIRGIAKDVIMDTPVDKGTLINNWYASNRAIPNQTTKATDPSGKASMARVDKALNRLQIGQTFYMANSLPYARIVEYGKYPNPPKNPTGKTVNGFSRQAPAGMVRINVDKGIAKLRARGSK